MKVGLFMSNINLEYICTVIGNLSGIPIRVYQNDRQVFYYSIVKLPKDPLCLYINKLLKIKEHVGYFITPIFNYYGVVRSDETTIIIGPTRQVAANEQDLRELAFQADVPSVDTDDFVLAMKNIIRMPLDSIIQILFTINHILNGEQLSLKDIKIFDAEQENLKHLLAKESFENINDYIEPDDLTNNTFALEQTLMNIVRHGDTASLKQWIANAPAVKSGIIAHEQLRQYKNTFVVTATLVCRNAIRGGLDVHDSLALSDSYIKKCELLKTMEDITNLQYQMVLDYTERVERLRRGKQPTKLTMDVTNYVLHHLSEPIKIDELANALFISRSRLFAKFKKEAGVTLNDYILKEKAIEAKRLLRYTNKSIISISEYLGFSSPAHFSRVFKKYIGLSPNEYRERKQ